MQILENEPMKLHTSFKVGGPARYFAKAESNEDLKSVLKFAQDRGLPSFIIGNGTNLLVSDEGVNAVCITLGGQFNEIVISENEILKVGAGASLGGFARKSIKLGLSGIHKLAGIPGSIGGAIYMNAGAYGQEISQTCVSVETLRADGNIRTRTAEECNFNYRHSIFQELKQKDSAEIILSATFRLTEAHNLGKTSTDLETEMQECMAKRKNSQPLSMPNAGSTFKRLSVGSAELPNQLAPGYYIEQSGLKGYRIGGAEVSTVHANFLVNADNATANDIKNLSEHVQKTVAEKFGIQLQREIILLGNF